MGSNRRADVFNLQIEEASIYKSEKGTHCSHHFENEAKLLMMDLGENSCKMTATVWMHQTGVCNPRHGRHAKAFCSAPTAGKGLGLHGHSKDRAAPPQAEFAGVFGTWSTNIAARN